VALGERIGLRGDIGICSFYATKLMTTGGQGGAIVSRNKALIEKIRDYREFDCRMDEKLRFNFQMTDLQATIGRVQLKKLPAFLEQRERIFEIYRNAGFDMLESMSKSIHPVRYRAVIRCAEPQRLIEMLQENGVRSIVPIDQWELLDNPEKYPVANELTRMTVSLPIYPLLTSSDVKKIVEVTKEFFA
jgi:perosamine synthetase